MSEQPEKEVTQEVPEPEKEDLKSKPDDLRFSNSKTGKRNKVLRLKANETVDSAIERLGADGWNIKDQPYSRQGPVLIAVGKRVKGISKDMKPGTKFEIEYYDIVEEDGDSTNQPSTFKEELTFKALKGKFFYFATPKNTTKIFPVDLIVNATKLAMDEAETPNTPDNTKE